MNFFSKPLKIKYFVFAAAAFLGLLAVFLLTNSAKADPVSYGSNIPNPSCLDNRDQWPHSQQYNANADWNPAMFPFETLRLGPSEDLPYNSERRREQLIDLNGDGLLDYLFIFHGHYWRINNQGADRRHALECVYLNNGHGWDGAYRCQSEVDVSHNNNEIISQNYWGDCALVN